MTCGSHFFRQSSTMGFPWFLDVFHIGIASVLPSGKLTVLMGLLNIINGIINNGILKLTVIVN